MPKKRSQSYLDQRQWILQQTAILFAQKGYAATSMNDLAQTCHLSKAALYHYTTDKYALLVSICEEHVQRLESLVSLVTQRQLSAESCLRELIQQFVEAYADAEHAHCVLIAEVKFLNQCDRERILSSERRIVAAFAVVVQQMYPGLSMADLAKPLTMLLFGMINWMFTWLKPKGKLTYQTMAPLVADLFLGGLGHITQTFDAGAERCDNRA